MTITEKEIRKLQAQHPTENDPMPFARALLALQLERLAACEMPEAIGYAENEELTAQREYPHNVRHMAIWYDKEEDTTPLHTSDQLHAVHAAGVAKGMALECEECAKVAEDWSKRPDDVGGYIARNIRARGTKEQK